MRGSGVLWVYMGGCFLLVGGVLVTGRTLEQASLVVEECKKSSPALGASAGAGE